MPELAGRIDEDGAVVNVVVTVDEAEWADRSSRNEPVPSFPTTGLIDAGASRTAVHPMVLGYLGIKSTGFATLSTPGREIPDVRLFDVRIALGGSPLGGRAFEIEVLEIAPATSSVLVLIGRDVLRGCDLHVDGPNAAFTLRF